MKYKEKIKNIDMEILTLNDKKEELIKERNNIKQIGEKEFNKKEREKKEFFYLYLLIQFFFILLIGLILEAFIRDEIILFVSFMLLIGVTQIIYWVIYYNKFNVKNYEKK